MNRLCSLCIAAIITVSFGAAVAADFPAAPRNLEEAEASGLARLDVSGLSALFRRPVVANQAGPRKTVKFIFSPDGTVERAGGVDKPGTWRIDVEKNVYCKSFHRKKGYTEECFAVYRAPDSMHYFDYNVRDKLFAQVWRRAGKE